MFGENHKHTITKYGKIIHCLYWALVGTRKCIHQICDFTKLGFLCHFCPHRLVAYQVSSSILTSLKIYGKQNHPSVVYKSQLTHYKIWMKVLWTVRNQASLYFQLYVNQPCTNQFLKDEPIGFNYFAGHWPAKSSTLYPFSRG